MKMPKNAALPPALNLTAAKNHDGRAPMSPSLMSANSLNSPMTPRSIPGSPLPDDSEGRYTNGPTSPRITAMPEFPPSPDGSKHGREPPKSFFSNFKASKSSHRLQSSDSNVAETMGPDGRSRASSKDRHPYSSRTQDSHPELPRVHLNNGNTHNENTAGSAWSSHAPPGSSDGVNGLRNKNKSKLGGILNRARNGKMDDDRRQRTPVGLSVETNGLQHHTGNGEDAPLKTAPLKSNYRERAFGAELGSQNRTRSADRQGSSESNSLRRPPTTTSSSMASSLPKEPSSLLANIQQTGKGVGQTLGKASKGLFSKMTRSGSSTEREMPIEENYVCTVINLPLVKQTRKTRIAKKMELSRDKTEFWMPALPWRCIDYLNMNGCEEEGLYRIPGSGREVKMWQKRFDTEHDIDLFEEPDLYDINTIGSMFKSWLRELPDEILPKAVQNKVAQECAGAQSPPQLFKDEISKLPPFNYYLLFAITCHLSLLHSFAEKNKMDFRNLCICFQPCLKIDAFCFSFLVLHWKECFQGCWTERDFLQEEYRWEREGSTMSATNASSIDERAVSSSGSSQVMPHHQALRSTEAGLQRKGSMPQMVQLPVHSKNTSTTTGNVPTKGHGNSSSLPAVPRIVQQTPEQRPSPDSQLPELGNLSPIRM